MQKKELENAETKKEEALAQIRTEYDEKLTQKDLIIREQTDKISSLEKELVNRMTQPTVNAANQPNDSLE
ncbi:MAG: hypothetical protein N2A99_00825 [Carnobacterium alterfunditum]